MDATDEVPKSAASTAANDARHRLDLTGSDDNSRGRRMGIPLDRIRIHRLTARLDRFLARRVVRVVIFAAVFLWVWLFLASGVATD